MIWPGHVPAFYQHIALKKGVNVVVRVVTFATAAARVTQATSERIALTFTTAADPALYDSELSLRTRVPADWTACVLRQADRNATLPVTVGQVTFSVRPGPALIVLTRK